MTLLALQRDFRAWLDIGDDAQAARFPPSARTGLLVYQNNFRAQVAECLELSFPVTRQWLGNEAFHASIVAHATRLPPSGWTMDAYPRDFPATLAQLYPDDPEVTELALLELALAEAFVASDAPPVTVASLADVDWDHATLRLSPSLRIDRLTTNAPAIWSAIIAETSPPGVEHLSCPAALLSWRNGEVPSFRTIDEAEADALRSTQAGLSFGSLCAELAETSGKETAIAASGRWLGQWIADGLIIDIKGE